MSPSCDEWIYPDAWTSPPSAGFIGVAIVGLLGIVHNALLLTVAYRIKWFQYSQFFLIINQSMVDLLASIAWTVEAVRILLSTSQQTITVLNCILINLPANILFTLSQRCALTVAFDRLFSLLFPFRWMRLSDFYRFFLIALAVIWATAQESCWLFVAGVSNETCFVPESQCYRLPEGGMGQGDGFVASFVFGLTSDFGASALIILFYIIIPCLSATLCKRVICGQENVQVYCSNMEQQQRRILVRVRLMSFATVGSYLCTMCIGLFFTDSVIPNSSVLFTIFMALSLLNTVPPLYLFAWKDEAFRCELKQILKRIFCFCGLVVTKEEGEHKQSDVTVIT